MQSPAWGEISVFSPSAACIAPTALGKLAAGKTFPNWFKIYLSVSYNQHMQYLQQQSFPKYLRGNQSTGSSLAGPSLPMK